MARNVLIVIGLILFGVLVFCLCCYKVTNLLYQLFTIDSQDLDLSSPARTTTLSVKQPPSRTEKSAPPPQYSVTTPRCSRHARLAGEQQQYHSKQDIYASKEEVAMVNLNHFPSAGELRDPVGYTSVERLLPPYPAPPRTESAISYSYSNLSDVQPGLPQHQHSHCSNWPNCPNRLQQQTGQHGSRSQHQLGGDYIPPPVHHLATLRRNNSGLARSHPAHTAEHRYQAPPPPRPFERGSRESLSDREVSAVFHRDTLLARL